MSAVFLTHGEQDKKGEDTNRGRGDEEEEEEEEVHGWVFFFFFLHVWEDK